LFLGYSKIARLRLAFESSRVDTLCAFTIRLPRCVTGAMWGLHLGIV